MMNRIIEGFATNNVFNTILTLPSSTITPSISVPGRSSGAVNPNSGASCPGPTGPTGPISSGGVLTVSSTGPTGPTGPAGISPATPPPFLRQIINNEKDTVESLLRTAAKIGPMANNVVTVENASDAAFEASKPAPIPSYGSTVQGFTFILLFWSFLSFAIVMSIYINNTTGNTGSAVGTFIGSLVFGAIVFALIKRFG
jgi:hypothetical protein